MTHADELKARAAAYRETAAAYRAAAEKVDSVEGMLALHKEALELLVQALAWEREAAELVSPQAIAKPAPFWVRWGRLR